METVIDTDLLTIAPHLVTIINIDIPEHIILQIHSDVYAKQTETCSNIGINNHTNQIILMNRNEGQEIQYDNGTRTRGACNYSTYSSIVVHTHTQNLHYPPSAEDIVKVMKHQNIQHSLIGCEWGVWVITNSNDAHITFQTTPDITNIIRVSYIDKIINLTRTPEKRKFSYDKIKNDSNINGIFEDLITQLSIYTNLEINLFSWQMMQKHIADYGSFQLSILIDSSSPLAQILQASQATPVATPVAAAAAAAASGPSDMHFSAGGAIISFNNDNNDNYYKKYIKYKNKYLVHKKKLII